MTIQVVRSGQWRKTADCQSQDGRCNQTGDKRARSGRPYGELEVYSRTSLTPRPTTDTHVKPMV